MHPPSPCPLPKQVFLIIVLETTCKVCSCLQYRIWSHFSSMQIGNSIHIDSLKSRKLQGAIRCEPAYDGADPADGAGGIDAKYSCKMLNKSESFGPAKLCIFTWEVPLCSVWSAPRYVCIGLGPSDYVTAVRREMCLGDGWATLHLLHTRSVSQAMKQDIHRCCLLRVTEAR